MYEILKAGGFTTGGLNFDAKVRRQSTDKYDLFYGHIGAMDTMALSLKVAARMIERGASWISGSRNAIPAGMATWGSKILKGQMTLTEIAQYAGAHNLAPSTRAAIRSSWKTRLTIISLISIRLPGAAGMKTRFLAPRLAVAHCWRDRMYIRD